MNSDDPDDEKGSVRIPVEPPDEGGDPEDGNEDRSDGSDSSNVTLGSEGIDTEAYRRRLEDLERQLKEAEGEAKREIKNDLAVLKSTLREEGILEEIRGDDEETTNQESSEATEERGEPSQTADPDRSDREMGRDDGTVDGDGERDSIEVSKGDEEDAGGIDRTEVMGDEDGDVDESPEQDGDDGRGREQLERAKSDPTADPEEDIDKQPGDERADEDATDDGSNLEPKKPQGENGEVEDAEQDTPITAGEESGHESIDEAETTDEAEAENPATSESSGSDVKTDAQDIDDISKRLRETEQRINEIETLVGDLRRKNEREHEMLKREALEDFASRLLKIRDTLDRAVEYNDWSAQDEQLIEGIIQQFDQEFTSGSIDLIDPDPGDEIDEVRHAFAGPRESSDEFGGDCVLRVERKGFEVSGYPLRRAKIIASERE